MNNHGIAAPDLKIRLFRKLSEKLLARAPEDNEWKPIFKYIKIELQDGEIQNGNLMRRRLVDSWEYRSLTDEELYDYISGIAW